MNRPPERLADGHTSVGPTEKRAVELLRRLQDPPRLDAAADARLERKLTRLAAGPRSRRGAWAAVAVPAALAAVIFLVARPGRPPEDGGRARGPGLQATVVSAPAPRELLTFRIGRDGRSEPLGEVIRRDDELAFAYRTDGSEGHLMIFARDQEGRIYWYHPAWTDPTDNPCAVPLARQPGVHELPAAIVQPLRGPQVEICGLFTTEALRVREVEPGLMTGRPRAYCRTVAIAP